MQSPARLQLLPVTQSESLTHSTCLTLPEQLKAKAEANATATRTTVAYPDGWLNMAVSEERRFPRGIWARLACGRNPHRSVYASRSNSLRKKNRIADPPRARGIPIPVLPPSRGLVFIAPVSSPRASPPGSTRAVAGVYPASAVTCPRVVERRPRSCVSVSRPRLKAMRTCPIAITLLVLTFSSGEARAEPLMPGLTYEVTSGYHVVVADVAYFELRANHPKAAAGADFATVQEHAIEEGAVVAINANYFDTSKGGTCGTARGFDQDFTRTYQESPCSTTLGWSAGEAAIFEGYGHEEDPTFHPEFTEMVTGGGALLRTEGTPDWNQVSMPTGRAMTAFGVTADRKQFVFLVTDKGTSSVSKMTNTLTSHGVTDGIFLDGGGSTRLWIEGQGYVNIAEGADRNVPVVVMAIPTTPPPDASVDAQPDVATADAQPDVGMADAQPDVAMTDGSGAETGAGPDGAEGSDAGAGMDGANLGDADAGSSGVVSDNSSEDSGCSCGVAGGASAPTGSLLAALLLVLRRRRMRASRFAPFSRSLTF